MCIAFFAFFPESGDKGGYRLVLAANRDETFQRPARGAHTWDDDSGIIAGMDLTPGKEGGTWLGVSKPRGRFAVLTNIRQDACDIRDDAKGRGCLGVDYLRGGLAPLAYCQQIAAEGGLYNGFNLLVGDITAGSVCYYSNQSGEAPTLLQPGIYGVSNSVLSAPWQKVQYGTEQLSSVLKDTSCDAARSSLEEQLFRLLSDKTCFHPDAKMPSLNMPEYILRATASIFVSPIQDSYGTRAQTVVLIDAHGMASIEERALQSPITGSDLSWATSRFQFTVPGSTTASHV